LKPVILLATLVFGVLVAGIIFGLGYGLLGLELKTAAILAGVLGLCQSVGGLFYIYRRFKYQGPPPRDGGTMG
jgi:uncharacterized membrane protein